MYSSCRKTCRHRSRTNGSQTESPASFISPKLLVNSPGDGYEQQADAVAEQLVNTNGRQKLASFFSPSPHGAAIQRKENSSAARPTSISLGTAPTGGQPLQTNTRDFMESGLGVNLENVRIHNDNTAHATAASLEARAFTYGNNIAFGAGEYQPDSINGKKLIAHELVHTIQQANQGSSGINGNPPRIQKKDKTETEQKKEVIPKEMPCKPTPLSRAAFLKKTKITDFGLTKIAVSQADLLSSPYVQFTNVGKKVKMQPLTLNMPVIESSYVQSGQFIEGQTKNKISSQDCPFDFYPINWNITSTGAASLEEAEQEHCNDYNFAYSKSVYPFLFEVNKAADAGTLFNSMTAADAYLKKKLKFDPHDWFSRFTCMIGNTTIRDHPQDGALVSWHEPKPITQVLPNARNLCKHVTLAIIPGSFSGLNNTHPTDVIIPTGC